MMSTLNGSVTYLALQRLVEKAWEDGNQERLQTLCHAVDAATVACLNHEKERQQAV